MELVLIHGSMKSRENRSYSLNHCFCPYFHHRLSTARSCSASGGLHSLPPSNRSPRKKTELGSSLVLILWKDFWRYRSVYATVSLLSGHGRPGYVCGSTSWGSAIKATRCGDAPAGQFSHLLQSHALIRLLNVARSPHQSTSSQSKPKRSRTSRKSFTCKIRGLYWKECRVDFRYALYQSQSLPVCVTALLWSWAVNVGM